VDQVCALAGVSKRHFYELFDDRLDLLLALHAEAVAWIKDGFDEERDPADPIAWLEHVVPWLFGRLLEDPQRAQVLTYLPAGVPGASPDLADIVVDGLVRRVRRVPDRPKASRERIRRHAVGAVFGGRAMLVEWLSAEDGPRRGRAMNGYVADVLSVTTAALAPVLPARALR
jgi:AcrR family transcriptional regulator